MEKHVLYSWGANAYGQLGLGVKSEQEEVPTRVVDFDEVDVSTISGGGGGHSIILDSVGRIWSCGWNGRGQLGLGPREKVGHATSKFQLVPLPSAERVLKIACGWDFSVALTVTGTAWGCGSNSFQRLLLSA